MKINNKTTNAKVFAYDGCHKIYLIESEQQLSEARANEYSIYPISQLQRTYEDSCDLRFISSVPNDLGQSKNYVQQFQNAEFSQ